MNTHPKIAIVIVNYNGSNDTIECINSIKKSNYKNILIIVIDNNSDERCRNILRLYNQQNKDVIIQYSDCNNGFSGGNNIGTEEALKHDVDYICFINNDTVVDSNFLINLVPKLNETSAFTGKILYYNDPHKIWFAGGRYIPCKGTTVHLGNNCLDNEYHSSEQSINFITGCYFVVSKKIVEKVGLWPERYFLYGEDCSYSLRIIKNGFKLIYVPNSVIYHKVSSSTKILSSLSSYYVIRNRFLVIKEHLKGICKISAYFFSLLVCLKGVINKEYSYTVVWEAIHDFTAGRFGPKNEIRR